MEFITRKCHNILDYFARHTRVVETAEVSTLDVYLEYIFKIIYWDDIRFTLKIFLALSHLYWLILILHLRFYGTLAFITLAVFIVNNIYYEKVLAEYKGEYSLVINEFKMLLQEMLKSLKALRRDSPLMFAAVMSVLFLMTRVISSSMPGAAFAYVIFLLAFFLPLGYKFLPEEHQSQVVQGFRSVIQATNVLAEDELIPYISNKDFSKKEAELESLFTDRTADSVTNSFASGITSMPSYLEVAGEGSPDILEEDLIPQQTPRGASCTPGELSSDSDSDRRDINFDTDHFDTSSSEEDAKGLQFTQAVMKQLTATQTDSVSGGFSGMALLSNVATIGSSLMANIISKSAVENNRNENFARKNSSSDSEFEIINGDEVDG